MQMIMKTIKARVIITTRVKLNFFSTVVPQILFTLSIRLVFCFPEEFVATGDVTINAIPQPVQNLAVSGFCLPHLVQ